MLLQSAVRQEGIYSAITSDWLAFNSVFDMRDKTIINIGVGNGGACAAALMMGAKSTIGIDLDTTFPAVPQRELAYKPSEVIVRGLSEYFFWHEQVWTSGGDMYKLLPIKEERTLIIDTDMYAQDIYPALTLFRGPGDIVIRFKACEDWLKTMISAITPYRVYRMSKIPDLCTHQYIAVASRRLLNAAYANPHSIDIIRNKPLIYSLPTNTKDSIEYVANQLNIPFGDLGDGSKRDLERLVHESYVILTNRKEEIGHADRLHHKNIKKLVGEIVLMLEPYALLDRNTVASFSLKAIRCFGRLYPHLVTHTLQQTLLTQRSA